MGLLLAWGVQQVAAQWTMLLEQSAFLVEPHTPELAGLSQFLEQRGVLQQPIDNEVPSFTYFYT